MHSHSIHEKINKRIKNEGLTSIPQKCKCHERQGKERQNISQIGGH